MDKTMKDRVLTALRRDTSSGQLIPEIDGLRFLAISSVLLYHLLGYTIEKSPTVLHPGRYESAFGLAFDRGWFGVDLFFVISGFVIGLPFARHFLSGANKVKLSSYYLKRVRRIEPPYIICITLCFLLLLAVKRQSFIDLWPRFLATLTYTHNLFYGEFSTINPVAWSLEIEIQFYILAPAVMCLFAIKNNLMRRALFVLGITISCSIQPMVRPWLTVATFMHFFLVGVLLADIYALKSSRWWDVLTIPSSYALYILSGEHHRVYYNPAWIFITCIALFIFCASILKGELFRAILSNRWFVVIGGMCYTIYLYHMLLISLFGRLAVHWYSTPTLWIKFTSMAVIIPPLLVTCAVFFLMFEKPFMSRRIIGFRIQRQAISASS